MTAHINSSASPVDWDMCYMIIDAAKGETLSSSFRTEDSNKGKQANLYHDLARIIVDVAQSEFPNIGSLTVDDTGFVSLSNRPTLFEATNFESVRGAYPLRRNEVLRSTEEFVSTLLQLLDKRMHHVGN